MKAICDSCGLSTDHTHRARPYGLEGDFCDGCIGYEEACDAGE